MGELLKTILAPAGEQRDRDFFALCAGLELDALRVEAAELDRFRRESENLYERVRATTFLYALYRFYLMDHPEVPGAGVLPFSGVEALLNRHFEEAIAAFRRAVAEQGPRGGLYSGLAEGYRRLAFGTLADQVRRSVRACPGNRWMFRGGHPDDHPVRLDRRLLVQEGGALPVLHERTPVRLDLSHSGWSDIFFLGMDYPEGARVLNISVDLGVYGRDDRPAPPIGTWVRAIDEPLIRLTSVDLDASKDVDSLGELFNFGNDYLGLLKAGVIASGVVPPAFEGTGRSLPRLLARVVAPGMGLELVTRVGDIPKGSRLAVSTNLLASMIGVLMRATGQAVGLTGTLTEPERRLVASRAILGEWLGGSGGGWQDSGGVWPGFKVIAGVEAGPGDPEHGISRGCLLPRHHLLGEGDLHPETRQRLAESLVLVHGGMAQNVGPILEMVTERYLLRGGAEWRARRATPAIFDRILAALRRGDMTDLAGATLANWEGPLKTIIPWVTNEYTERLIQHAARDRDALGFLMLGGMSGGGMGFWVRPGGRERFRDHLLGGMVRIKRELEQALPFAMDPVVYDFAVNDRGTVADLLTGPAAAVPRRRPAAGEGGASEGVDRAAAWDRETAAIKERCGFDPLLHEGLRERLRRGEIGLARNRLPLETRIEDVAPEDLLHPVGGDAERGREALRAGRVAVMTLAAGVGSRWTTGAGVVKAINPFATLGGRPRSFLEVHLAKTARTARMLGGEIPHLVATSWLTHEAIQQRLVDTANYGFEGSLYLSPGRAVGQRLVPMVRDLEFLWEETAQEILDPEKQKVREDLRRALMAWARERGEGSDYVDNLPRQRLHPPGHWYEVPNLIRNGVLARLLRDHPEVETIMLHNIDTLGADPDPELLGAHLRSERMLGFEVVPRMFEDRGGGLARVGGSLRLLEGLAQPREEDEFRLGWYNTMTTWIRIDPLLALFGLDRSELTGPPEMLAAAVRRVAERLPTYVTIKEVKYRWGQGQEDVYPVAQVEKLWSDMTWLAEAPCAFLPVSRRRGRQLKDPEQLDGWARDGGLDHVARLGGWAGGESKERT